MLKLNSICPETTRPEMTCEKKIADETPVIESRDSDEIRWDVVMRARAEIAEGTYETPEKLEAALDRLLADLSI